MIAAERRQFIEDYLKIRRAEGRGSDDPAYYLALPYRDLSGRLEWQWRMRARTYRYFEKHVLQAHPAPVARALVRAASIIMSTAGGVFRNRRGVQTSLDAARTSACATTPLDVLDLGAGCGWMSYRLMLAGHRPVAVDLQSDGCDGLGAARHYPAFPRFEAEFDRLPFKDASFDLAVYNASLHYSADYFKTLAEARRCLRPGGRIVILDTPVYRERAHGELMRAERHAQFLKQYGTASDHASSIEYLDLQTIDELARGLRIEWRIWKPWYSLAWHLRPLKAWWTKSRPPSRFWILEGRLV